MAFLINCPNCGNRSVYEFRFGGETLQRPPEDSAITTWTKYFYERRNISGLQEEWWYHSQGCRKWFLANRDTTNNMILSTKFPEKESK